ncbi:glycosyltransferase [Vibrio gallaecicus]|uniref:Glycosyltransferase n=1 Tax=Vibrio gallaecicus TaxID=552386 RepID=A0ABV4NAD1_9VIBR
MSKEKIESVSIIIPIYKNQRLLSIALKSIINQNIPENIKFNVYIIDDGSPEFDEFEVADIIDGFSKKIGSNIACHFYRNEVNLGTVKTLNRILSIQDSDLIIPLAVDDEFYDVYTVIDIIEHFNNNNCLIATAKRLPVSESEKFDIKPNINQIKLFDDSRALLRYIAINGNIISGASTYYRKEVFQKIGKFDDKYRLLEDYPFYLDVLKNDIEISFIDRITIKYNLSGISSGKITNVQLIEDFRRSAKYVVENFNFLTEREKRKILYFRVLTEQEKKKSRLSYIDCFAEDVIKKLYRKLKWG